MDNGTIEFFKNGTSQGVAYTDLLTAMPDGGWAIMAGGYNNSACTIHTSSDKWTYTPSTDFVAMSTANLPEPTIGPNSTTTTSEVFDVVTYTGNGTAIGSGGKTISGLNFQPDVVWIKNRDAADNHMLFNSVRGATKYTRVNLESAEATDTESLTSFTSDGFILGNNAEVNTSGEDYVAWCWKEEANLLDILEFTGTGTAHSESHSLGVTPDFIWTKPTNSGSDRNNMIYSSAFPVSDPETDYIVLNRTTALSDNDTVWGDIAPTSTTFGVGTNVETNESGINIQAFLWANMDGTCKTGSYTGNGSTDGPFIYTGFRPAFVIIKSTSLAQSWIVKDTERFTDNVTKGYLLTDTNAAEVADHSPTYTDILSNGFKLRGTANATNASGASYIYMAFAEMPFKYSVGR
jgi:hypothetical protein